jgi:hypothetical protein
VVILGLRDAITHLDILFIMTNVGKCFGVSRDFATHDRSYETRQALWFAKLASLDGLDNDRQRLVDLVIQFQIAELPAQEITDSPPRKSEKDPRRQTRHRAGCAQQGRANGWLELIREMGFRRSNPTQVQAASHLTSACPDSRMLGEAIRWLP